ncbi:MAG TPA: hypothetical protein VGM06_10395 [Polyangiaceae bacterium]|jgi:hypothetical protein
MPEPSTNTAARLKKVLVEAGFEVFRTRGEEIVLAERPRENLIMDSGVRLFFGEPFEVRIVLRAQKADFPNEDDVNLFERVRRLAAPAQSDGFVEVSAAVTPVADPSDSARTLDTFYEITYAKHAPELESALAQLRFALCLEKRA